MRGGEENQTKPKTKPHIPPHCDWCKTEGQGTSTDIPASGGDKAVTAAAGPPTQSTTGT